VCDDRRRGSSHEPNADSGAHGGRPLARSALAGVAAPNNVVVVAGIVATVPWWHRAATLGLRLRRLRVELVDDILTGALPPAEPVTGLVAAVEHLSKRHRRLRLLELLARAARDRLVPDDARAAAAPVQPVPALAVVGAPLRVWAGSAVTRRSASRPTALGSTP
jgi:hypothetical protein